MTVFSHLPIFRHLWFLSFLFRRYIGRKFLFLAIFGCVIYLGFTTASWFANSNSNSADGMGVSIGTDKFEITMLTGTDGIFSSYHSQVKDENALVWQMTADNNLINYNQPVGDDPGDLAPSDNKTPAEVAEKIKKLFSSDANYGVSRSGAVLTFTEKKDHYGTGQPAVSTTSGTTTITGSVCAFADNAVLRGYGDGRCTWRICKFAFLWYI